MNDIDGSIVKSIIISGMAEITLCIISKSQIRDNKSDSLTSL